MLQLNGLPAQNILDHLPDVSGQLIYMQQANYDRAGLNADGFVSRTIFDTIPHGQVNNPGGVTDGTFEYVLAHITGPAVLQRFWIAVIQNTDILRFYFDGETTPRLEKTVGELFYAQETPFQMPLVDNLTSSSGCYIMYFPMNVEKDLIITLDSNFIFHQAGYQRLPADTIISSWKPAESNSALAELFSQAGNYPKSNQAFLSKDSLNFLLNNGETKILFSKNSPGQLESIEMLLPSLNFEYADRIFDHGNYRKGTAVFKMKIDNTADSVVLVNRMNKNPYFIAQPQSNVAVRINGSFAGIWSVGGFRDYHFWENERFRIPQNLYQNKDSLTISIQYINGRNWNEFYYWMECNGVYTDSVDVRDSLSEANHQFAASGIVFDPNEVITARYRSPETVKSSNRAILDSVYIRVFYDDETEPSVEAPIGLFFGTGSNDAAFMNSLLCGNVNHQFYNFFSMPYWKNIRIELENKSASALPNNRIRIGYLNNAPDSGTHAYFKTLFRKETKFSNDKSDYRLLSASGKGKLCGIMIEGNMNNVPVGPLAWLEGDERIYIDDAKTPFLHGTGTEDFFNGGFYFVFDEYSKPQHGMTNSDRNYHRSMYRFFLTDPIYFHKNISAGIEHGGANDTLGNYTSLAFYYLRPDTTYQLTDSLDIGNTSSEQRHHYQYAGNTRILDKISSFEGEKFTELVSQDGTAMDEYSEFIVHINRHNAGVRLLRTYDYSFKHQHGAVYVNDTFVGHWGYVGNNTISQFRDDYFSIPPKFTKGRDSLNIRIISLGDIWTELYYKVFTIIDPAVIPTGVPYSSNNNEVLVYPNPSASQLYIQLYEHPVNTYITIFNMLGQQMLSLPLDKRNTVIPLQQLPAGTYFYNIRSENLSSQSGKFIKSGL